MTSCLVGGEGGAGAGAGAGAKYEKDYSCMGKT